MVSKREEFGPTPLSTVIPCEGYTVGAWCPSPDGSGAPEAVMLMLEVPVPEIEGFGLRLKSRRACEELIATLQEYTDEVFPA